LIFEYHPKSRLILIVGNYGSGKTEVSVNLALTLSNKNKVTIVDMDIVNPYFRCRESREEMEAKGIRVVYPKGQYHSADLPIILPEVKGSLFSEEGVVIFDVGGDNVGARVLSSLADHIVDKDYQMLMVLNTCRPFTHDIEGCIKIMDEIEEASRLKISGLISNSHLLDDTDVDTVKKGLQLSRNVAERKGLSLEFATIGSKLQPFIDFKKAGCPLLNIERRMLPPWKLKSMTDRAERILKKDS